MEKRLTPKKTLAASAKIMLKVNLFKRNKKGDTDTFPTEMVYIVVAALLLIFIAAFFYKLYAAATAENDDGSKVNFQNKLAIPLENLMKKSQDDYSLQNYYLGKDYMIVGFDTQWDDIKKVANVNIPLGSEDIIGKWALINIYKPFKCGNTACICLYNKDAKVTESTERDTGIIDCITAPFAGKNVVFYSYGGDINPKTLGIPRQDVNGNYLVFFGKEFGLLGKAFGVQRIYIEKQYKKNENKYYIFISKDDEKSRFGGGRTGGSGGGASY